MTYEFECAICGKRDEADIPVALRNDCAPPCCNQMMRRRLSIPNIIGTPYHLQEGNRFKGDVTDYKAYRRKYDKMHEKQTEQNREWSTIQAQMTGAEIVKADEPKPLIEMYKEAGGTVRG